MLYTDNMNGWNIEQYTDAVTARLKNLYPVKIILFGSAAQHDTHEYSDLDILIVLNVNYIPETYEDKLELKLTVREQLGKLSEEIPIDIIVFTKPEYVEFLKRNSAFCREIHETGQLLYETAS